MQLFQHAYLSVVLSSKSSQFQGNVVSSRLDLDFRLVLVIGALSGDAALHGGAGEFREGGPKV